MARGKCIQKAFHPGWTPQRALLLSAIAVGLTSIHSGTLAGEDQLSLDIRDYYSRLNKKRPVRPSTKYIVLHTTEGREEGSLKKIRRLDDRTD